MRITKFIISLLLLSLSQQIHAQTKELENCNVVWTSQSKNSSESMPCGGGSIGLNVWMENNELLFYIARSGSFDENNGLLKAGRVRIKMLPNPFAGEFRQELDLKTGTITVSGIQGKHVAKMVIWVNVFRPVIHVEMNSTQPVHIEAIYENWRYQDRALTGRANDANSWKWAPQGDVKTFQDRIDFENNSILFYHRNKPFSVFDVTVKQQGLESVKNQLFNPLYNLTFGGSMYADDMMPAGLSSGKYIDTDFKGWKLATKKQVKKQELIIALHTDQTTDEELWKKGLQENISAGNKEKHEASIQWWKAFWDRSFIFINPERKNENDKAWEISRNYQLFRYMLGCNAYGDYPTKFNGGLFTYDPSFTDSNRKFTPDHRNWGGGVHTAQNQRLVYFPMIRSGDFDMMTSQFKFYLRILKNAELRSRIYWDHNGACFTEQMENFGLPNAAEYDWKRPANFDPGVEYNAWLEYEWDTVLEFCLMILEKQRYTQLSITEYLPLIESCLRFFDEHYQYLAKSRGKKSLDGNNHLVLYPGSGAETFKMATNSTSTIAALKTVTTRMLELPDGILSQDKKNYLDSFLKRIPPFAFTNFNGQKTIAPAWNWERINNSESPQLYPVFPWSIYGIGKPDLDIARNTFLFDTNVLKFKSHVGWKQDNIFAARLGLTEEAKKLNLLKLKNSGRRFPAFWGPGFDWTPDHNWGGSGMIGLQEMLMQTDDQKIYLFPAWPKDWNVHFKLHAKQNTTVEAELFNGELKVIKVIPEERKKDIINLLGISIEEKKKLN
jgi:hypothetical protein